MASISTTLTVERFRKRHISGNLLVVFLFRFIFWFWKNCSNTFSLFWLEQVEVWLWLMLIVISMMPTQSSVAENGHLGKRPAASWWIVDHETRETTAWTTRWYQFSIRSILRVERRFSMTKFFWCLSRLYRVSQSAFLHDGQLGENSEKDPPQLPCSNYFLWVQIACWSYFKFHWW